MQINTLFTKGLAVGIIFVFVGTCITPAIAHEIEKTAPPTSKGGWLYVGGSGPGNYSTIQSAINAANDGDTVFVFDDSAPYSENIVMDKGITLLGENEATTVMESYGWEVILSITADHVKVSGFTIRDGISLYVTSSDHVEIVLNNITDTENGVYIVGSSNVSINNNVFYKNIHNSFYLVHSRDCTVFNNRFYPDTDQDDKSPLINFDTMVLSQCTNCSIQGNTFRYNPFYNSLDCWNCNDSLISNNIFTGQQEWYGYDITVWYSSNRNVICDNSVENGISLYTSNENILKSNYGDISLENCSGNIIIENWIGACSLSMSNNNSIYHNYFAGGSTSDDGHNAWDHGYPSGGNYWSNYHGKDNYSGVNQDELGSDGIGDTRYLRDQYPLMLPYGMTNLTVHFNSSPLKILISIFNNGTTTALNVQWELTLKGGILFCKRTYTGIVKPMLPGKETTVSPGMFLFGFGRIQLTLSAWADNAPRVTAKASGTLILFYFFIH